MSGLDWPDAKQNSQNFRIVSALSKSGVQAVATLFDSREVECRRIGNGLDVIIRRQVGIASRNGRKLPCMQVRNRLGKHEVGFEIRVMVGATVSSPPTGVQGKLHQVCKP